MTLRSRLVLALVALSTVGLAVFGVATYSLYQRSQESLLDDQLRENALPLSARLQQVRAFAGEGTTCGADAAGDLGDGGDVTSSTLRPNRDRPERGPAPGQGLDAYAELRDATGTAVVCIEPFSTDARPDLPDDLASEAGVTRVFTTGSVEGDGQWRVLVTTPSVEGLGVGFNPASDELVVLALPAGGIAESMRRPTRQ